MRHRVIEDPVIPKLQEELGATLSSKYNGKSYTVSSLGATVVGICDYPPELYKPRRQSQRPLTTSIILSILKKDFGLGKDPIDLELTGEVGLFSKNPAARRQSLGLLCVGRIAHVERAAINEILGDRGYPRLKSHGLALDTHVSVGNVDTHMLSDVQREDPSSILPAEYKLEALCCTELRPIDPSETEHKAS